MSATHIKCRLCGDGASFHATAPPGRSDVHAVLRRLGGAYEHAARAWRLPLAKYAAAIAALQPLQQLNIAPLPRWILAAAADPRVWDTRAVLAREAAPLEAAQRAAGPLQQSHFEMLLPYQVVMTYLSGTILYDSDRFGVG